MLRRQQQLKQNATTTTTTTSQTKYNNNNDNNKNKIQQREQQQQQQQHKQLQQREQHKQQPKTRNRPRPTRHGSLHFPWASGPPESTATQISGDTPGVSWKHLSRPITFEGPAQTRWALRFLRLSVFSTNQGPEWPLKTRAIHEDQS